jgi:hypothetical protein
MPDSDDDWFGVSADVSVAQADVALGGSVTPVHDEPSASPADDPMGDELDEDWFVGGSDAPHPADAGSIPPAVVVDVAPHAREAGVEPPALVEELRQPRGRPRKRPAAAPARAVCPARGQLQLAVAVPFSPAQKLAQSLFQEPDRHDSVLMSHSSLAEQCGIQPSKIFDELCGLAHSAFNCMNAYLTASLDKLVAVVSAPRGVDGVKFQGLLFVRWRKYDETPMRMKVKHASSGPEEVVDPPVASEGPQKILVTEAGWCANIRKFTSDAASILTVSGDQPTVLQSVESNKAECLSEALKRQLDLPCDHRVQSSFLRTVEVAMTDEHAANMRCERARHAEASPQHSHLHLVCDAHKIFAVTTSTFSLLKPWDSRMIRLALSVDGMGMISLRSELKKVLSEQLVVMHSSHPSAAATVPRKAVYDMFMRSSSPKDRFRRSVVESLFNGDIRICGVVQHYENGCCKSRQHTLDQMMRVGVSALLPRRFQVLARSNWTGTEAAMDSIGLPACVHGLLACCYVRAFLQIPKVQATES